MIGRYHECIHKTRRHGQPYLPTILVLELDREAFGAASSEKPAIFVLHVQIVTKLLVIKGRNIKVPHV